MEARARLGAEDQSRWDGQFIGGLSKLTMAAERREKLAQIPRVIKSEKCHSTN
jgi:hypothetical protein